MSVYLILDEIIETGILKNIPMIRTKIRGEIGGQGLEAEVVISIEEDDLVVGIRARVTGIDPDQGLEIGKIRTTRRKSAESLLKVIYLYI